MTLTSTNLIPELQHWLNKLIVESDVNKYGIPHPVFIDDVYMPQRSFIELLFNENYIYDSYKYLYRIESNKLAIPYVAQNRIQIYPQSGRYYVLDSTGDNLFNLTSNDLTMLNALLQYRIDATSMVLLDTTTNISFSFDTSSSIWILSGSIDTLITPLSKLIYIYLDFKINNNADRYNTTSLISNDLLSYCYEIYILETIFDSVTDRGIL